MILSNLPIPILAYALWGFKTNDFQRSLITLVRIMWDLYPPNNKCKYVGATGMPFFFIILYVINNTNKKN